MPGFVTQTFNLLWSKKIANSQTTGNWVAWVGYFIVYPQMYQNGGKENNHNPGTGILVLKLLKMMVNTVW